MKVLLNISGPGIWTIQAMFKRLGSQYNFQLTQDLKYDDGFHPLLNTIRVGAAGNKINLYQVLWTRKS